MPRIITADAFFKKRAYVKRLERELKEIKTVKKFADIIGETTQSPLSNQHIETLLWKFLEAYINIH